MSTPHETTPIPDSRDLSGLPPEALSSERRLGRYPGRRNPRSGDLVLTVVFSVILAFIVVLYVTHAIARANDTTRLVDGLLLADYISIIGPVVVGVFSLAFSTLFVLRRVWSFWLPVVASILIIALYSVTQDMIDTATLSTMVR